jgi:MPBQ/MSBQ methyltransferase
MRLDVMLALADVNAGGHLVIATWCQRKETPSSPFTDKDRADLQFLYDEWAHPYFVSVEEYGCLLEVG